MTQRIDKSIAIEAPPATVWKALTDADNMKLWMSEPEMKMEVITDWNVGNSIVIKGFHHAHFENKGKVLQFEAPALLHYTSLSSLSRLPDLPENYLHIEFRLTPSGNETTLMLTLSNFPTETIAKHIDFYWTTTLGILKVWIEQQEHRRIPEREW